MKRDFPLFQTPIDLAHKYWKEILHPKDHVIDATCGNGYDTLALSKMLLPFSEQSTVISIDIQEKAIKHTRTLLETHLLEEQYKRVFLYNQSHASFPLAAYHVPIRLIVYNLGYLPKSDKSITTMTSSTLESFRTALSLLISGGAISVTCYPGHAEGLREQCALLALTQTLNPSQWSVSVHSWPNRIASPTLLFVQKTLQ